MVWFIYVYFIYGSFVLLFIIGLQWIKKIQIQTYPFPTTYKDDLAKEKVSIDMYHNCFDQSMFTLSMMGSLMGSFC